MGETPTPTAPAPPTEKKTRLRSKTPQPSTPSTTAPTAAQAKAEAKQTKQPTHVSTLDTNNDEEYWKKTSKGYIYDQLSLRGYRAPNIKKLGRLTKAQLAKLIITIPIPK
jgi:hypothetical protein